MSDSGFDTGANANLWQKGRKGPDSRQRPKQLNVRVSPSEADRLAALAESRGLSVGAFIRETMLAVPAPKRTRRPRADEQAVARLLGDLAGLKAELGKSGSNLNQIAHYLNSDRSVGSVRAMLETALTDHEEAMRALLELRQACLDALGSRGRDD